MSSENAIFMLDAASKLHEDGYITDEAYERYKQHIGIKIIEEYYAYKKPWWKIW